jgi:hypothetical protein
MPHRGTAIEIRPFHRQPFMNSHCHFLVTVESTLPNVSAAQTNYLPRYPTTSAAFNTKNISLTKQQLRGTAQIHRRQRKPERMLRDPHLST